MQTLPTTTDGASAGAEPNCGFARVAPELHVCTDRDGAVVTGDKACFAWARHQLRTARLCPGCDNGTAAPGETIGGVYYPPERCSSCYGTGVALVEPEDYGYDLDLVEGDWPVAS